MSKPKERKVFSVQEKINILAIVDANTETRAALAARLGILPSTLNTIVKKQKIQTFYTQCVRFSGQRKSLKQPPFKNWRVCWPSGLNELEVEMQ
jgi:transposase-like protein